MKRLLAIAVVAACAPPPVAGPTPAWVDDTSSFGSAAPPPAATPAAIEHSVAAPYRDVAARIVAAARADRGAYDKLSELTDRIGHRLSGSPELDRAIAWAVQTMTAEGLEVHTEKVMVPHWVRGAEDAAIVKPIARPLAVLGVGDGVATPKGGITAPVVVVHDWDDLAAKADQVKGAIVLFDVPMPPWTEEHGSGYGDVIGYRLHGPSRAAKLGAAGMLIRALTNHSLRTPHTGTLLYDAGVPKIPAGELSVEDADLLARLAAKGPVTVHLHLEAQMLPDAPSANVIGELRGREAPDEVVVIGGHLDSWDVGQGAHDDGTGVVTMMETLHVLRSLGLRPRRTIRVVLFTNEENGTAGGKAYAAQHAAELGKTVLALESDSGGFAPRGFTVRGRDDAATARLEAHVAQIEKLLGALGVKKLDAGFGGSDIEPMAPAGVPQVGLVVDNRTYFDIHHTEADTLDKVDPAQLADDVAAVAVLAYIAADAPGRLDR